MDHETNGNSVTTDIFLAAQDLPEEERARYVEHACGTDTERRERVEKLLNADRMVKEVFGGAGLSVAPGLSETSTGSPSLVLHAPKGRYEDLGVIGKGGMGEIRLVRDPELRRDLAMKTLLTGREETQGVLDRFVEEAQLTAQLAHPGVVPVHELGRDEEGKAYFTMARVEGEDLRTIYRRCFAGDAEWTPTRTLGALLRVCETMAFAHARGVIHRDLKPANVMVGAFGEVYVMDWGIAKIVGAESSDPTESKLHRPPVSTDRETATAVDDSKLTLEGQVMGTAAYMSPEQALGHISELDKRSDVYAIGAMLYELLAGAPPYEAQGGFKNAVEVIMARRNSGPAPVHEVRTGISAELAAICDKATADKPGERYRDTGEMAADLRAYLEDRVVRAYRTGPIVELTKWVKRNRGTAAVLMLLMVAIFTGLSGINMVQAAGQRRVLRLSDKKVVEFLEEREKDLWPPLPERREDLKAWLTDAEDLLARRDDHERAIAALDSNLEGQTRVTANSAVGLDWTNPALQDAWQREVLGELLESLDSLEVLHDEIRDVRLKFADEVEQQTLTSEEAVRRWQRAIEGVRSGGSYDDLELKPQLGLLPLGVDPDSGLWEFWHVQSGDEPKRDDTSGRWIVDEATGIVLVLLPGGRTTIGASHPTAEKGLGSPFVDVLDGTDVDEHPAHELSLEPFLISKYEVTQAQWQRLMKANPSTYGPENHGSLVHPVTDVSWFDCEDMLRRTDLEFPTEAQYEYAARAGSSTRFPGGNEAKDLVGYANVADLDWAGVGFSGRHEQIHDGFVITAPVGSLAPNSFGLHDMHGNVWSWCLDLHESYDKLSSSGFEHRAGDGLLMSPEEEKAQRASAGTIRGGSFSADGVNTRSSNRFEYHRDNRDGDLGLRPTRRLK